MQAWKLTQQDKNQMEKLKPIAKVERIKRAQQKI